MSLIIDRRDGRRLYKSVVTEATVRMFSLPRGSVCHNCDERPRSARLGDVPVWRCPGCEETLPRLATIDARWFRPIESQYGDQRLVVGTGRSRCKVCDGKIAKGQEALRATIDLYGGGSNTAMHVFAHLGCLPKDHSCFVPAQRAVASENVPPQREESTARQAPFGYDLVAPAPTQSIEAEVRNPETPGKKDDATRSRDGA